MDHNSGIKMGTLMDKITFKVLRDGSQLWFKNGKHSRKDGPSEIYINGIQFWYKNGVLQWLK